jgi:hypothetical protein
MPDSHLVRSPTHYPCSSFCLGEYSSIARAAASTTVATASFATTIIVKATADQEGTGSD